MSGFGAPGNYDDAELERQLQEHRRRQALQQSTAAFNALAAARARPEYTTQHLSMLGEASPYYAAARTTTPYSRVANPYGGLADTRATAYAQARTTSDSSSLAQQIYALSGGRQAQVVANNYAAAYGGAPAVAQTTYASPTPPSYARSPAPSSLEQQRYAYGLPATSPAPAASYASRETSYAPRDTTPYGSAPAASTSTSQASSLGVQQQQQKQHQAYAARSSPKASPPAAAPAPPPPSYAKSPAPAPARSKPPATPRNKTPSRTPKSSTKKESSAKSKEPPLPKRVATKDGKIIIGGKTTYYTGCLPLGLDDDKYWLSELQVYLRSNFAEAFGATEEDIAAPMHGRNKPIALGQVGIRCKHCKHENPAERGQQATSYPSLISGIYNSVQQMLRLHLDCCLSMPTEVRMKIEALKVSCSSRGGRKQYWVDSARRLGLVDTAHGIHFGRDPYGPLPPLTGPSVNFKEGRRKRMLKASAELAARQAEAELNAEPIPPVDDRPLVFENDRPLISDYLYLTLEQMAPCSLMEADRVGCYKTRKVGFPGLACKHCVGQAGCGRYFPASEASLSQTTTSQTIMNHVRNCRRCPNEIRENLEIMKRNRMGPDGKKADKPKHGGRKVFFHRLWCRIQGLTIEESKGETKESKKKKGKRAGGKRKKQVVVESDSDDVLTSDDDETESEEESDLSEEEITVKKKRRGVTPTKKKPLEQAPWFEGCVRLTKTDDPHWLSEMECFARSDLIEVFSLKNENELNGYAGRKEPAIGQVGVRCVFCKTLDPAERPPGCVSFPESLSTIHMKVTDMIRLHFPGCPSIPKDAKGTFKSLRGFDAKVANDDAQQFWIDAARDIGLSNTPPGGSGKVGGWGITFRRDPLQPSPADELDLENTSGGMSVSFGKNSLIRDDDRGLCTDQVMLLMRQVQPCRFKKSDRRAGPGHRGRDRAMGFPGLSCKHCAGQNTLGRYFAVSAKNMTDCTSNSLQTHVSSCAYCPEPIRASLAYLGHRSILQKAELKGCWKKAYFKKIWDRLHVERKWKSIDDMEGGLDDESGSMHADEDRNEDEDGDSKDDDTKEGTVDGESDSEKEELGDQMNALIKAAAIWLTEQDAATDVARAASRAAKSGRALPSKRLSNGAGAQSRKSDASVSSKRRRVHF